MRITILGTLFLAFLAACGEGSDPAREAVIPRSDTLAFAPIDVPDPALPDASRPADADAATGDTGTPPGTASTPAPIPEATDTPGSSSESPPPLAPAIPAAPAPPPAVNGDAERILANAEASYEELRSMQAEFVQTVEVPLLGSTQRSRGTIFTRAPDRFLMRFAEPEGDIILADGQYVWMYHPGVDPGQVMRGQLAAGGQQVDLQREFLSDANRRFEVVRTGAETIGGRETHALTLTPRQPSPYSRVRLWVDTRDNLVRRFEITELNESVRTLEVSNLQPNATIGDDVFRWSPPAGAQVYDIQ